ncbi:MAG: thioredoxin domain-containing protein [Pyrinomonadaceae bacterium]|nr:thioredoxin domain-containing protein [Pyrinomonadaceae bacterium]
MKQTIKFFTFFSMLALFAVTFGCDPAPTNKNTANKTTNTNQNNSGVAAALALYKNAPPGAQPPNMLGSPTASVTVEEFADFQCPSCAQVHSIMKSVQSTYGNRIKFIYRHFPLNQMHKNAYDASLAAESAGEQNRFWDMQNQLFTSQKEWSTSTDVRPIFVGYAQKMGLDVPKFQSDMLSLATKKQVDEDIQRGTALKLDSTPSIYINGKSVAFQQLNLEAIRAIIDAELQNAGNSQSQPAQPTLPANNAAVNSGNTADNTGNAPNTAKSPANK